MPYVAPKLNDPILPHSYIGKADIGTNLTEASVLEHVLNTLTVTKSRAILATKPQDCSHDGVHPSLRAYSAFNSPDDPLDLMCQHQHRSLHLAIQFSPQSSHIQDLLEDNDETPQENNLLGKSAVEADRVAGDRKRVLVLADSFDKLVVRGRCPGSKTVMLHGDVVHVRDRFVDFAR